MGVDEGDQFVQLVKIHASESTTLKQSALLKWLIATVTTVALGLATWVGSTLVQHEKSIAAGEAERPLIIQRLDRIEDKVDRLLRRNPRRDE